MKLALQKVEAIDRFGGFTTPVRNIRAYLDEMSLTLDLIPCRDESKRDKIAPAPHTPTSLIIEGDRALRLQFTGLRGWMIHEEFVDHISFDDAGADDAKRLPSGKGIWPLLLVVDSAWKAALPDYQRSNPRAFHYRIYSMTTYHDVLAELESGEWVENKIGACNSTVEPHPAGARQ